MYISFIVSGVFGIVLFTLTEKNMLILTSSLVLIFTPKIASLANKLQMKISLNPRGYLIKLQSFINSSILSSSSLMSNYKILIANYLFTFTYIIITFVSFNLLNEALNLRLEAVSIFFILIITRVSSLIRILPGNLGVEEVYMAGIFKIIVKPWKKGCFLYFR